jgi:uncharacterized LabA/DUF88 family protein
VKNVGVFVNASLLFYVTKTSFKRTRPDARIDYNAYLKRSVGGDALFRAFAYGAYTSSEAAGFIACLERTGFTTRYVQAVVVGDRDHILNTDRNMDIAMDIMRIRHRLDVVVLGSNDVKLIPLVEFLKDQGIKVIIFSPRVPRELRTAADEVWDVTDEVLERRGNAIAAST